MRIIVIGYYDKNNLGDDAYEGIMNQFFPNNILDFVGFHKLAMVKLENYDAVIVGGGDIIDDTQPFLKNFKGPKIAFSIGIPFPSFINDKYLGHYDHVFTRNYEDVREIQKLLGSNRAHFIPDISLAYKPTKPHKNIITDDIILDYQEKKCGVFLIGNLIHFPKIVENIAHIIGKIALTHNVVLYCFNIAEDKEISDQVRNIASRHINNTRTHDHRLNSLLNKAKNTDRIIVNSKKYSTQEMIDNITELDFAICMRYHSHIFCTVAGTPFMSISTTRKTRSYMNQAGLTAYQYEIPLNAYGTPIDSNYEEMREICSYAIKDRTIIAERLRDFLNQSNFLLSNKQANRLLTVNTTDIRTEITKFIKNTKDYQNGARLLSNYIIGYPDSPHTYEMYEKLKDTPSENIEEVIYDSAQYLLHNGAIMKNKLADIVRGTDKIVLSVDLKEYQSYRGGWYSACEELYKLNSKNEKGDYNGIICDMYINRTFHWALPYMIHQGSIPYTSPWCGFLHHTPDTEILFKIPEFIQSLHTCVALFTLSEPLSKYLREKLILIAPSIKVFTFAHPVATPTLQFSPAAYFQNKQPKLINIVSWLRNPFTIYRVPDLHIQKAISLEKDMKDHLPPENIRLAYSENNSAKSCCSEPRWILMLKNWLQDQDIKSSYYDNGVLYINDASKIDNINEKIWNMIKKVNPLYYQTNEDYDDLLSKNIAFLDLDDTAGVNTVIECIIRRTPIIINKIPGTIALLGENYPMFYKNVDEIPSLITSKNIENTYRYIRKLDIRCYQMDFFINHIMEICDLF